jgi:hypothetical protein
MEHHRLQEGEHAIIYCRTCQLHKVIDQRIAAATIRMEEAARQIEPGCGERLTRLPFADGVTVGGRGCC